MTATGMMTEKGMATLEMLPLLFVFIYLFSYMLGVFGIVHTGIKDSIAAREYAFETFRNRSCLVYFRDIPTPDLVQYRTTGARFHAILSEDHDDSNSQGSKFEAPERMLRMGIPTSDLIGRDDDTIHNDKVHTAGELANGKQNTQVGVNPAWIQVQYGICLDAKCGDK